MSPVRRYSSSERIERVERDEGEYSRPVQAPRRRQAARRSAGRVRAREEKSTPLLLRVFSWIGVLLLCFVVGYLGATWFMKFLSEKLFLKPENRIENQEDLEGFEKSESRNVQLMLGQEPQQISLNLYHVMNDTIASTRRNFPIRTQEDNISDAVNAIISLSELPNSNRIKLLHVFRDNDTAFLDMSGQFPLSLESAGQRKSLLLLTGIVRTMQENFSPISQIRFLIDSKQPKSGGTVDLSVAWKMPKSS